MDSVESILQEAQKVIEERRASYGSPKVNLEATAKLWTTYFSIKVPGCMAFTAADVAMFQILLKVAREGNEHKRDNLVDISGYAVCYMECTE